MQGLTFSSKLDQDFYIISIAKTASKKIRALNRSMNFLFPEVAPYFYKSSIRSCIRYCCYVYVGASSYYLERLDKPQKQTCRNVGPLLAASLEPSAHLRNVASLKFFIDFTLVDVHLNLNVHLNCLNWFHFLILLVTQIDCMIFLSLSKFLSSYNQTLEFSAYRMLSFDPSSKQL